MFEIVLTALLLASAVSVDTLTCGFAYGTSKTHVPFSHILVLNLIGSLFLGLSLFLGYSVGQIISPNVTLAISVTALSLIGCYRIFKRNNARHETASRQISWGETLALSFVLSVDSLAVGIGASIYSVSIIFCLAAIGFSLVTDVILFCVGHLLGQKVANKNSALDLSWLSGVVLILIAVSKFIF